jgi:SAM-dependent methyltransferase
MLTLDFDRLGVNPGDRILDIGCGFGRHSFEALRRGCKVVSADLALPELRAVRDIMGAMSETEDLPPSHSGDAACTNILSLPFPDGTFDRVIASEVLEHIPDDTRAMAELSRVTRPGGTLAVTVPRTGQEVVCWALSKDYHNTPGGHVRIYRRSQVVDRLRSVGLRPKAFGFAHALHTPYWWLRCAVGPRNETNRLVRGYKSFLEWDITKNTAPVRLAERLMNPVLGKSLVVYVDKPAQNRVARAAEKEAAGAR